MVRSTLPILLLALSACTTLSHEEMHKKLQDTPPVHQAVSAALSGEGFESGEWPSPAWWEAFHDATLSSLIEQGLASSPTLSAAEARVKRAFAFASEEKSTLFPKINLDGNTNWQYLSAEGFDRSLGPTVPARLNEAFLFLDFNYEFDFFGKNHNLFRAALSGAHLAQCEADQVRITLSVAIALAYVDLVIDTLELQEYEKTLENRSRFLALTLERREGALDDEIALLQAQGEVLEAKRALIEMEKKVAIDQGELKMLLGKGPDAQDIEVSDLRALQTFPLPTYLSLDLVSRRADLSALIFAVEAKGYEIGVAKAGFYPSVNLLALGGFDSLHWDNFLSMISRMGSFYPSVHLPIFTGPELSSKLKEKKAEWWEVSENYNEALLRAVKEVNNEIVTLKAMNREVGLQEERVNLQGKELALSEERFEVGIVDERAVLAQDLVLISKRLQEFDLKRGQLGSNLMLIKALGGGWKKK